MLTRMNIVSDCQSDVWWCSMGLKACVLCDTIFVNSSWDSTLS